MSRPIGQTISLVFAALFYLGAATCAVIAFFYTSDDPGDPVHASLMASVVFFVGGGIVLHVIGTARLKGLLSGTVHRVDDDED